jgi:hypothetical protein
MMRRNDWQIQLEALVRDRMQQPFVWGSNDCALFAADAVEVMTGDRPCPELRAHRDARSGLRTLAAAGGVRAIATRALGDAIPVQLARVGDIVVVPTGKREALAVCNGTCAIAVAPVGLTAIPMEHARAAWRVG